VDEGYNPSYGARPLRRAIMRLLEDSMAERMLSQDIKEGDSVIIDVDADGQVGARGLFLVVRGVGEVILVGAAKLGKVVNTLLIGEVWKGGQHKGKKLSYLFRSLIVTHGNGWWWPSPESLHFSWRIFKCQAAEQSRGGRVACVWRGEGGGVVCHGQ